jgi:hypothetical protein
MREFLETVTVIAVGIIVGAVGIAMSAGLLFGGVRLLWILNCGITHCH